MQKIVTYILIILCIAAPLMAFAKADSANLESRRKALNALLAEQWEYTMQTSPEFATILGDKRFNDRLSDFSQAQIDRDLAMTKKFFDRFSAIDTSGFPEQEALNKTLMVRNLREQLDNAHFKDWEMPINQMSGAHIDLPQLVAIFPFDTVKDYDDYIARLKQIPRVLDENVVQMKKGMAEGLMPPKLLLEKVAVQAQEIGTMPPEKSPFAQPLDKLPKNAPLSASNLRFVTKWTPDTFSEADKKRLRQGVLDAIKVSVNPAYMKFTAFVRDEYAPKGRTQPGIWSLPDGDARYVAAVKRSTTTNMTPEEIHQLGLKQVAELESQMMVIAKQLGYNDLKSLNAAIEKDPKLHGTSRKQILDEYRKYTDQMWAKLPTLFGRLPKARLKIMPIEEFNEKTGATHYNQGTPDGSRSGHVMVNTGEWTKKLLITDESTAYHEGVPGHHMQVSIAQELPTLPPFRQQAGYTAYAEGWALYSERLGKEIGFYQNPYSDYGRLQDEMLRAIRLVVDSGFHYKHWTREQVVNFFHDHSNTDEPTVQSETDRYIAWPAQALAYKVGQLTILKLRGEAQKELGNKFDIKGFHDEVLGAGGLPMDVLEARIHKWIEFRRLEAVNYYSTPNDLNAIKR
jgi:uncharacterized protein (DUF885 family)